LANSPIIFFSETVAFQIVLKKTLADLKDKSGHAILGQFADLWTGIISKGAEFIFAPETHSLRRAKTGYYDDLTHADQ